MNILKRIPPVYFTIIVLTIEANRVSGIVDIENAAINLLTLLPDDNNTQGCDKPEFISCVRVSVHWEALEMGSDIVMPTGDVLKYKQMVGTASAGRSWDNESKESPKTVIYTNDKGSKAILTSRDRTIYGTVELVDRKEDYRIETVGDGDVVWALLDHASAFINDEEAQEDDPLVIKDVNGDKDRYLSQLISRGESDTSTIVEFSVTIYYTKEFRMSTSDPAAFIDQLIAETNEGYINSRVPLRVKIHCVMETDIPDGLPPAATLRLFTLKQKSLTQLRVSADTAVLLVNSYSPGSASCGLAWFNSWSRGQTLATVRKTCALGYYSFGHEIGHGFGLAHDRKKSSSSSTPYAFGHIIKPGSYRSIMSYDRYGEKRVNYYSSPDVKFDGWKTGSDEDDNARALTRIRFAVANIGDETMTCPSTRVETRDACRDRYRNCSLVASTCCWDPLISSGCPASCGLCPGQRPMSSLSCYDRLDNCHVLVTLTGCSDPGVSQDCRHTCRLC